MNNAQKLLDALVLSINAAKRAGMGNLEIVGVLEAAKKILLDESIGVKPASPILPVSGLPGTRG